MTLDEAIEHAEERACGNDQCAKDYAQLSDWLRELREARLTIDILKILRDGFKEDVQEYKAENDKLREMVFRMCPICMEGKRCTFADRIYISSTMEELGIEANWEELGIDG